MEAQLSQPTLRKLRRSAGGGGLLGRVGGLVGGGLGDRGDDHPADAVAAFDQAWRAGQALSLEQVVIEAVALAAKAESMIPSAQTYPAGLTAREVEVLRLVAQGLTNFNVAAQLVISPRTVNTHLGSIYRKLNTSSRAVAARFALEHGLV